MGLRVRSNFEITQEIKTVQDLYSRLELFNLFCCPHHFFLTSQQQGVNGQQQGVNGQQQGVNGQQQCVNGQQQCVNGQQQGVNGQQ